MGMMASTTITAKATVKRLICCAAQGWKSPPPAETIMANPMPAMVLITNTMNQLTSASCPSSEV